jgi:pimeloyl-ACP methyl ester carboxylesterase
MTHDTHPQFRWLERGDGEPVILLHGLMGHMDHWDSTLDGVAPLARLLAPELPLFEPSFEDVSLGALADHVRRFMDALDIGRAVVGGNSLGGHVALELALAHPERVSGLVLTGSSGLFERSFSRGVPHRPTAGYVREKMEEVFYDPAMVTDAWVESVLRTVTTRFSALRVLRVARAARTRNIEPLLAAIEAPALLVWGRDDRVTPPGVAERFHQLMPRSWMVFLPRCGHAAMLEQPAAFTAVLRNWLTETRPLREMLGAEAVSR